MTSQGSLLLYGEQGPTPSHFSAASGCPIEALSEELLSKVIVYRLCGIWRTRTSAGVCHHKGLLPQVARHCVNLQDLGDDCPGDSRALEVRRCTAHPIRVDDCSRPVEGPSDHCSMRQRTKFYHVFWHATLAHVPRWQPANFQLAHLNTRLHARTTGSCNTQTRHLRIVSALQTSKTIRLRSIRRINYEVGSFHDDRCSTTELGPSSTVRSSTPQSVANPSVRTVARSVNRCPASMSIYPVPHPQLRHLEYQHGVHPSRQDNTTVQPALLTPRISSHACCQTSSSRRGACLSCAMGPTLIIGWVLGRTLS